MAERKYYNRERETMSREDFLNYQLRMSEMQRKYNSETEVN